MNDKPSHSYPSRQPFPRTLVVSLEGETSIEVLSTEKLCTYELPAYLQAKQKLESYFTDYGSDDQQSGVTLGIKGAYGSGKTHLLRYLMQTACSTDKNRKQVYVKAESSDFLTLYRRIMAQIDYSVLDQINTVWLSQVAKLEAGKRGITKGAVEVLDKDPSSVYEYLNKRLLSPSAVEKTYLTWVQEIVHYEDFLKAISYLSDPLLGRDSYNWFLSREVSPNNLRRLGIKQSIDSIDMAKAALRFWVTVFGRADQPFLLYIDQLERLLLDTSSDIRSTNLGVLHSLAEIFSREHGFLCLAGVTEAWSDLPQDFFDRLHLLVDLPSLSFEETLNLVKIYLSPSVEFQPYSKGTESYIYPYTEAAVGEMLRISQGNIRRILRLGYRTFEEAAPDKSIIDIGEVEKASRSLNEKYFNRQTILDEISIFLRKSNLAFVSEPKLPNNIGLDIAIPSAEAPEVLIEVSDAIFYEDEAQEAIKFIDNAKDIRNYFPYVKLMLVVSGYLSSEVQKGLSQIVDYYLVYDPDKFESQFSELIDNLKSQAGTTSLPAYEDRKLKKEIEDLRRQLGEILQSRQQDSLKLDAQLNSFSKYQRIFAEQTASLERLSKKERELQPKEVNLTEFLPALLFWGGGLFFNVLIYGWGWLRTRIEDFTQYEPILFLPLLLISILCFFLSIICVKWAIPYLLKLTEGYWPAFLSCLRKRKIRVINRRIDTMARRWVDLAEKWERGEMTSSERETYIRLDRELLNYPVDRAHLMPTSLGNIVRAAEEYPYVNYGLEFSIVWPRLMLVIPESIHRKIEDARRSLNESTSWIAWGNLFSIWSIFAWRSWFWGYNAFPVLWYGVFPILVSYLVIILSYRELLNSAKVYAQLVRSAFDLYRFNLYDELNWPRPTSPETEDEHGRRLTKYLFRHFTSPNIRFSNMDLESAEPSVEKFQTQRFQYLINAGNAAFYWQSQEPPEFAGAINNSDTRLDIERIIRRTIEALEILRLDTEFYDVILNNQWLEREPDDVFLSEFIRQERDLMIQAGMDLLWGYAINNYLNEILNRIKDIRDVTKPLEPFISWSQIQDSESRRKRVSYLKQKLIEIKGELIRSSEELNQATIPSGDLQHIQSTLFRFCLFTGGITLVFIGHSNLVDASDSDFSRLSIMLGSILAADSWNFAE